MENIYKVEYPSGDAFFFEIDQSMIILQKGSKGKVHLFLFDTTHNNERKKVVITKENFEMFQYFEKLYSSFKLEESLNDQITIDSLLRKYPVEYETLNREGSPVSKLSMNMDDDTITIYVDNLNEEKDEFVVSADENCYPIYCFYNDLSENFCERHQIDVEELFYKQKKCRVRVSK